MKDFINQFNNSSLDFDGVYGGQCVDLAKAWLDWLGYEVSGAWGNAIDWDKHGSKADLEWIPNTPSGVPKEGDLIVWNWKPYGHIAIFVEGDVNSFKSFDQNYPVGNVCAITAHSYSGVKGWLRPLKYKGDNVDYAQWYREFLGREPENSQVTQNREPIEFLQGACREHLQIRADLERQLAQKPKEVIKEVIKEVEKIVEVEIPVEIIKEIEKNLTEEDKKNIAIEWIKGFINNIIKQFRKE